MENFNAMAYDFDTDKRIHRAKIIADKIREHIEPVVKKSALEYGCGTGLVGLNLVDCFDSLLFVDSSPRMLNQVKQKNPDARILCADLMENVPKNLKVDYIFSSLVLHHIKNTEDAFCRFYDMLSDGGRLIVVDIDEEDGSFHAKYPDFDGHNGFSHSYLNELALKTGFKTAIIETFYRDIKVFNGNESLYSLFILDAIKEKCKI